MSPLINEKMFKQLSSTNPPTSTKQHVSKHTEDKVVLYDTEAILKKKHLKHIDI